MGVVQFVCWIEWWYYLKLHKMLLITLSILIVDICTAILLQVIKKHSRAFRSNGLIESLVRFITCSLWPSDAIWRHGSWSTLVQVMVCCLTAPSHYLNQCWLIITHYGPVHQRAISIEISQPTVTKISLKIIFLRFYWNLPRDSELNLSINIITVGSMLIQQSCPSKHAD